MNVEWAPPGDGVWWLTTEHFPAPVSRLFTRLFPALTDGWESSAARYGLPLGPANWAAVNSWYYFSPGSPDPATYPVLETAATETCRSRPWRSEVQRWLDQERPRAIAANLALQHIDPAALDDDRLRRHIADTISHLLQLAPLHFQHGGFDVVCSLLLELTTEHGIAATDVVSLLAGASPATVETADRLECIAAALRDAGVSEVDSLDAVAAASPDAHHALSEYLSHYGWRAVGGHEVIEVTLGERPDVVLATIRHAFEHPTRSPAEPDPSAVRAQLPEAERARFDELLADAREAYQLRDDDVGITYTWPMGLIRRAVLEAGRRLDLRAPDDLFEADPEEIDARLRGETEPSADELAGRTDLRIAAAALQPPPQLGDFPPDPSPEVPLPPHVARLAAARGLVWGAGGQPQPGRLRGIGIGTEIARGRACVITTPGDLDHLEPGDILVATATTTSLNSAFPLVAGVATAEGGVFSHAAILSREYGVAAVVGVAGLLDEVRDGDLLEVDPGAAEVRVVARADGLARA